MTQPKTPKNRSATSKDSKVAKSTRANAPAPAKPPPSSGRAKARVKNVPGARRGPFKLTPELQERIVPILRTGVPIETSCKMVGISKDTFYEWCKLAHDGTEPFASFSRAVEQAIAESEARDVAIIARAATNPKLWTAAAWRLERRFPERWGRRDRVELEAQVQGSIRVFLPPEK